MEILSSIEYLPSVVESENDAQMVVDVRSPVLHESESIPVFVLRSGLFVQLESGGCRQIVHQSNRQLQTLN